MGALAPFFSYLKGDIHMAKVKALKAVVKADLITITLESGKEFVLEDLTGRKALRIAKELGGEAIRIGKKIPAGDDMVSIVEAFIAELDDDALDRVAKALFDGNDVLALRLVELMELVEKYVAEVDFETVFTVAKRILKQFNGAVPQVEAEAPSESEQ